MMHASESHSGIVLVHKDRFHFGEQIRRLERLARAQTPEDMVNAVVFLQDWGDERDQ